MPKVLKILTALLIFASFNAYSQTKFNLNIYGGYSMPLSDLTGDFPDTLSTAGKLDFTKAGTLLTKSGFNAGAVFKYAVDTSGNARVTGGLGYQSFSGSKEYSGVGTYNNKVNIITISAGAEYSFSPGKKVNPFVGFEGTANFFSGKIEASGDTSFTLSRMAETRFGVTLGGGLNIQIKNNVGIVLGVKYALANLIGKSTESTTSSDDPNTDDEGGSTLAIIELPLNDGESSTNRSKNINYLQIYAGISINFGDVLKK